MKSILLDKLNVLNINKKRYIKQIIINLTKTNELYINPKSWTYHITKFKNQEKNIILEINIPIIENLDTIESLEKHCETKIFSDNIDLSKPNNLLKKMYPNKDIKSFNELNKFIIEYNKKDNGTILNKANLKWIKEKNKKEIIVSIREDNILTSSKNIIEWSKEELDKFIEYSYPNEILFIVTPNTIYFDIVRHF